jgi:hypothetical protein
MLPEQGVRAIAAIESRVHGASIDGIGEESEGKCGKRCRLSGFALNVEEVAGRERLQIKNMTPRRFQ